jgi:DNA-binding transcriptional LysR family regulator
VSVELIMTDQISDLVEGKFDLAIHAGSAFDSSLIQRVLGKARRVVCASPIYLALRGTPRIPEDLTEHNCLTVSNSSRTNRWRFTSGAGEHEIEVAGNLRSNSIEAIRAAALKGQGICLLPLLSVAEDLKTGRLQSLLPSERHQELPHCVGYGANRDLLKSPAGIIAATSPIPSPNSSRQ